MGDEKRTETIELSPEASAELRRDMAAPGADTPERRGMFARMERTETRLKDDGFVFDDEPRLSTAGRR